jgi:hypothetical protein
MIKFFVFFLLLTGQLLAAPDLKVGDILLQPLKCWSCALIEAEEETIFSHIGIVIEVKPEVKVAEAFGKVVLKNLKDFHAKTEQGQKISIRRFRNERVVDYFVRNAKELKQIFQNDFEHRQYDHNFLWNNFDENGDEKFYCSELVSKLISAFIGIETPIKRMHFIRNREHWIKYFKGNPPDGQWGNSPGDFERSELFYEVGEI